MKQSKMSSVFIYGEVNVISVGRNNRDTDSGLLQSREGASRTPDQYAASAKQVSRKACHRA